MFLFIPKPRKPKKLTRRLQKKRLRRISFEFSKWFKRRRDYHDRWMMLVEYPNFYLEKNYVLKE